MSEFTIRYGKKYATIDTNGAWLTRLCDDSEAVLYPQTYLQAADGSKKLRGGCHVCLPNFGPGGGSGLDQHGFGRTLEWDVEASTSSELRLSLVNTHRQYAAMKAYLTYALTKAGLTMTLELINSGTEDLVVAPAFHPYFATYDNPVRLNEQEITLDDYAVAQYRTGVSHTLEVAGRKLALTTDVLTTWAVWSDKLGPYLCVEPTQSGDSFDVSGGVPSDTLRAEEALRYVFSVGW